MCGRSAGGWSLAATLLVARERWRMTISETSSKARSKSAAVRRKQAVKPKVETETKAAGGGQARAVKCMLTKIEEKMSGNQMKATLGDYFPNDGLGFNYSGMPFYDAWNLATFAALYGHAMATITVNTVDPAAYPDEVAYLPDGYRKLHHRDHEFRARDAAGVPLRGAVSDRCESDGVQSRDQLSGGGVDAGGAYVSERPRRSGSRSGAISTRAGRRWISAARWVSRRRNAVIWWASAIRPRRGSRKCAARKGSASRAWCCLRSISSV